MEYLSKLGSIFYYDNLLNKNVVCDANLLFILGLEAITNNNVANTRSIVINKVINDQYEIDVFNSIYKYLKINHNVQLKDDTLIFRCSQLKEFISTLTGTGAEMTVPIIFHDSDNSKVLSSFDQLSTQAEKIYKLFEYAGYDRIDSKVPILGTLYYNNEQDINYINEYNKTLLTLHNEKKQYSQVYKLLDYKAMYSYALGVLYGCLCLGYDEYLIWHTHPDYWYDEDSNLYNLVCSAYNTFRFHYAHKIQRIDADCKLVYKYKGIQQNKLWNFDNNIYNIKHDEVNCTSVYINDYNVISMPIIYSQSTGPELPYPGSYLIIGDNNWRQLDSSVIDTVNKKGIVDNTNIIRYIANDEVVLSSAYKYADNKYLSPSNNLTHFVYTGNLGWTSFSNNAYEDNSYDNPILTFFPTGFDRISANNIKLAKHKETNAIYAYYQCYISNDNDNINRRSLFGILPNNDIIHGGIISVPDDTKFTSIVSDELFNSTYEYPINLDGYTLTPYYNIGNIINIYVYNNDTSKMWNDTLNPIPIVEFGYTKTPSAIINSYIDSDNNEPELYDLRYNSDSEYGYWSNNWNPKEWKQLNEITDETLYILINTIPLYKGNNIISNENYYTIINDDQEHRYIFNNNSIDSLYYIDHGFIPIIGDTDSVYSCGITIYPCQIIYKDDLGNSLLDESGNPLVWYDSLNNKYWNGLFNINKWQIDKPIKTSTLMYDSELCTYKYIYDDVLEYKINIDGTFISYNEFYSHNNYGIIRTSVNVFNGTDYLECYIDTYDNRYCIPNITNPWCSRSDISNLGYRFVDGTATLYYGNNDVSVVYDNDPID